MKEFIHQQMKDVLNHSIQDTTNRFAGIQLVEQNAELSDDICTVHTMLEGNHRAALLLCADTALLTQLAQNILHSQKVTPQDVEDVAKEYLNNYLRPGGGRTVPDRPCHFPVPNSQFPRRALPAAGVY